MQSKKFHKYKELSLGVICTVFGLFYLYETTTLKPMIETFCDAKFIPYILGILMCLIGVLQIADGVKAMKVETAPEEEAQKSDNRYVALMILVVLAYAVLLRPLGFVIATILVMFCQMLILSPKEEIKVVRFLILSVIFTAAIYVLFRYGLKLILPGGILG